MKKVLIIALAMAMVISFTVMASAKTKFTVNGEISFTGKLLTNPGATSPETAQNAMISTDWLMNVKAQVGGVGLNMQFRALEGQVWGTGNANGDNGLNGVYLATANIGFGTNVGYFALGKARWDTGTFRGAGSSNVGLARNFGDGDADYYDYIYYGYGRNLGQKAIGNFTFDFFYWKITEADAMLAVMDQDLDYYKVGLLYNWTPGGLRLTFDAARNFNSTDGVTYAYEETLYEVALEGWWQFGPILLAAQIAQDFGQQNRIVPALGGVVYDDELARGRRWEIHLEYANGPWFMGGAAASIRGDDGVLVVGTSGATNTANGTDDMSGISGAFVAFDSSILGDNVADMNINVYMAFVEYNVIEKLWVGAAVSYLIANYTPAGVSKNLGAEIAVGLNYVIMPGLEFGIKGGFFRTASGLATRLGYAVGNSMGISSTLALAY